LTVFIHGNAPPKVTMTKRETKRAQELSTYDVLSWVDVENALAEEREDEDTNEKKGDDDDD
jgi:hypothetical protein